MAGGDTEPYALSASSIGDISIFSASGDIKADDPIKLSLLGDESGSIRHVVSGNDLLVFLSNSVWRIFGREDLFTPTDVILREQSKRGSSHIKPLKIDESFIHEGDEGRLYSTQYTPESNRYHSLELSVLAEHLFKGVKLTGMAMSEEPYNLIYMPTTEGHINILSFYPDEEVLAFARWETDGFVESVATIPNKYADHDDVYFVVKRYIEVDGEQHEIRNIEILDSRGLHQITETVEAGLFVDSGLGAHFPEAVTSIHNLWHLRGRILVALIDGGVYDNLVVGSDGVLQLPVEGYHVCLGLPYETELQTLSIENPQNTIQSSKKKVNRLYVQLYRSRGLKAGFGDDFFDLPRSIEDDLGFATGTEEVNMPGGWRTDSKYTIKQTYPLPMTILSITPDIEVGNA